MIGFVIHGEAVAQARPRFDRRTGRAYDSKDSRSWKERVYFSALPHKPDELITKPVLMRVAIYKSIPKSWSKRKKADAAIDLIRPTGKPDLSNIVKGIEDALNGVIWQDDSQIVGLEVVKHYTDKAPHIWVMINELEHCKSAQER